MRFIAIGTALIMAIASSTMAQEHRELGPHVHGAGTLKIAIDGKKIAMDFSAPANDVLGFEHQPNTPAQAKSLAVAKETLANPLKMFVFPAAAGCSATGAHVVFNAAETAPGAAPSADKSAASESQHADFDVDYELTCAAPDKITSISFPYFDLFASAQKLTVTVVSDVGQTEADVARASPTLTLK